MAILSTPLQYLTSIPLATRILAGLLFFFSLLQAYLHYSIYTPEPYLTLLPGAFLRRPWTFVTAIFVEKNPLVVRVERASEAGDTLLTVFRSGC